MELPGQLTMIGADAVERLLTYETCVPLMAEAMKALSCGRTRQLPRAIVGLTEARVFGVMAGALAADGYFGAKLVSVFGDPLRPGRTAHRGLVVLFDPESGDPVCVADAEAVTIVRTAAASAAATAVLARTDASMLAILGCGRQAAAHAKAIASVRELRGIKIWGRSPDSAAAAAERISHTHGLGVEAVDDVAAAVGDADIICTTTTAKDPILADRSVRPGTHLNLVGSSGADAAEVDSALVQRSRFFVESRESALEKAGEFLRAKAAGLVDDDHIAAEIGEVMLGARPGRTSPSDITVYKSVGHAVQDLAATAWLFEQVRAQQGHRPNPAPSTSPKPRNDRP